MGRVGSPQEVRKGDLLSSMRQTRHQPHIGHRADMRAGGRAMAYAGQVFTDPITGTHIVVLKTSAETGGKLLQFEEMYPPRRGKEANSPHVHLTFDERFEIVEGRAAYVVNGEEQFARA